MATSTTFEERLQRIGAERAAIPGTVKPAMPNEKTTNRLLFIGLGVTVVLAVGVSIATAVWSPSASDGTGSRADDGWEPVISKGLAVGSGEREGRWQRVAAD